MAIGNYWEAVLPRGASAPPLQRIIEETATIARDQFPSWRLEPDGKDLGPAEFTCLGSPQGDLRTIAHLIKTSERANFCFHSAFPWLAVGAPALLTVYGINTDIFALEGFVEAGINGRSVTFFDPLFALNKAKYQVGRQYDFMLAAVSLDTRRAIPPEFNLMMKVDPEASDHYRFRGYLHIARTVTFLDQPFEVFRTAVSQAGAGHLFVDIYVNRSRLDASDVLVSGATITGTLWLQGSLAV